MGDCDLSIFSVVHLGVPRIETAVHEAKAVYAVQSKMLYVRV